MSDTEVEIITDPRDLREGDLMFGPIHGLTGAAVGAAQLALAIAEPGMIWKQGPRKWFRIRHCGVVTRKASEDFEINSAWITGYGPRLVQAMPGGAEEVEINSDRWNHEYVYIRPPYDQGSPFEIGLENRSQRFKVARAAEKYAHDRVPYDFATYGAIPLYRRGIRTEAIKAIISGTDTMMCSRLLDAALEEGGVQLFDDGRMRGNVTPSEAYRQVLQMPYVARTELSHIR